MTKNQYDQQKRSARQRLRQPRAGYSLEYLRWLQSRGQNASVKLERHCLAAHVKPIPCATHEAFSPSCVACATETYVDEACAACRELSAQAKEEEL